VTGSTHAMKHTTMAVKHHFLPMIVHFLHKRGFHTNTSLVSLLLYIKVRLKQQRSCILNEILRGVDMNASDAGARGREHPLFYMEDGVLQHLYIPNS